MRKRVLFLLVCSALLAGCSVPGMKELKAYCEKDAEGWISEPIYVDGYFINSSSESQAFDIVVRGFDYIEMHKSDVKPSDKIQSKGYVKIYKAKKGNELCNRAFDNYINRWSKDFSNRYCIATESISYPESRYWILSESLEYLLNNKDESEIFRWHTEIKDVGVDRVIAKYIDYGLAPWPKSDLSHGIKFSCKDVGFDDFETSASVFGVIKSAKGSL